MSLENSAYILGALTAGGGTWGYIRTGSVPSIAFGLSIGSLFLLSGYQFQQQRSYALPIALFSSVLLAGASIPRAFKTQKPIPIGLSLLAIYGLYTFGGAQYRQTK